jgi:hypothetical protein
MIKTIPFALLRAGLLLATAATCSSALAQQAPADRQDAALAYAQCVRDNGYAEFPDPDPEGGFKFLIQPGNAPRFKAATAACAHLAPEGMRDEDITPAELDALIKVSQCIRENGVPEFPDPTPKGNFDLGDSGIKPGDTRLETAMAACRDGAGGHGMRITIGG